MTDAVIFTRENCTFCVKAKALLENEGYLYQEMKYPDQVSKDDVHAVMPVSARHKITFPQIVLKGQYLGGCDDLEDYLDEMNDIDFFGGN